MLDRASIYEYYYYENSTNPGKMKLSKRSASLGDFHWSSNRTKSDEARSKAPKFLCNMPQTSSYYTFVNLAIAIFLAQQLA